MARLSKVRIGEDGRWFVYFEDTEDEKVLKMEFKIGSSASASYKRKQRGLARRHLERNPGARFQGGGGLNMSDTSLHSMQIDLALELLQDWRGVENEDGTLDVYSKIRAEEVLSDPAHGDLVEWIAERGAALGDHVADSKEDTVENSGPASDG